MRDHHSKSELEWPNLEEVIVVCKTHFDIGYTHRVKEFVHYIRTAMIDKAMDIMDQGRKLPPEQQFAWTSPGWVMSRVLDDWEGQTPERKKRLDDYVKSGRFKFHALPFTLESDACEPEEMARGLIFASNLSRKYNMPLPNSSKMTDVPSHGGALATVLANGGVKFIHIGCNWPSGYVTTPGLFWWEGPDGSRILALYSSTYGTATGLNWPEEWGGGEPNIGHNFVPPKGWPYKVWPAILVTLDNSGPPSAEDINKLFEEAQYRLPGVKIRMGTMDDFVTAILADKPELPVVRGEMPDTWIHGIMCDPKGIQTSRTVHPQLAAAEALNTQLGIWGVPQPSVANDVARAYENILLYGEHTWGISPDIKQYGDDFSNADPELVARLEASWEDKTDYIRTAANITSTISNANLKALAENVNTAHGDIIVYNPLPWTRSGIVAVESKNEVFSMIDNSDGEEIFGEWSDSQFVFFAKNVPACGYKTYTHTANSKCEPGSNQTGNSLENEFFKIILDPSTGSIGSLIDKRTGREWVDSSASHKLGQYLNERFTFEQTLNYTMSYQMDRAKDWPHPGIHKGGMIPEKQVPYRAASCAKGIVTIGLSSATIECPADPINHMPATVLKITLDKHQPYIDLELTIQNKEKDNWPEADWLCLPFKVATPQFRVHRQLGDINPATDILPGANRDLFSVGHGVTITDADGAGIAVCPLDHPLVSLDRPGCWKISKDATEFTPKEPVVYLNLYNNQWNTNFRYWYPGTWSSRVRLWTFDTDKSTDAVIATPALEARNPFIVTSATGMGKTLPTKQSGVCVSRKGILLTAFGPNPDGDGTLLRVWEQAGVSGKLTVTLPVAEKFSTAMPVNLRGEKVCELVEIKGSQLTFDLNGYAPASFILK